MESVSVRLDKWLKFARFFKRRSEAAEAVEGGAVKLNGERVKPAKPVRAGDTVTIRKANRYRNFSVLGVASKPVSAPEARKLYESLDREEFTPEEVMIRKALEEQERENRKIWREKPDKKQLRELRRRKYDH